MSHYEYQKDAIVNFADFFDLYKYFLKYLKHESSYNPIISYQIAYFMSKFCIIFLFF